MPSSISNSNERIPNGHLLKTWLLGLAVAVLIVSAWEGFWRFNGFRPSLQDNAELWGGIRAKAAQHGSDTVVFAGSSRVQGGLRPEIFADATGKPEPLQLAVGGCKPGPLLEHLARDESFTGLVICGIVPAMFFSTNSGGAALKDFIREYEERSVSPSAMTESFLSGVLNNLLCYRIPELAPQRVSKTFRERRWSKQNYRLLQPNRCRYYDMSLLTNIETRTDDVLKYIRSRKPMSPEQMQALMRKTNESVKRIQERGGAVVFIRMPSSGAVRRLEAERCSREEYWDVLAEDAGAPAIHFEDHPQLAKYACPEGSHLDYHDTEAFTRDFVRVLGAMAPGR